VKPLLDQNLSHPLIEILSEPFPGSSHVRLLGLEQSSDDDIWRYARDNGFAIVTRDADFMERSIIHGHPPKVILLRIGNTSTANIRNWLQSLLAAKFATGETRNLIREFLDDPDPRNSWFVQEGL